MTDPSACRVGMAMADTCCRIAALPDELLERILTLVPFADIFPNCKLVCRRWRAIIRSPSVHSLLRRDSGRLSRLYTNGLSGGLGLTPINLYPRIDASARVHRKDWYLRSLNGMFVDDDDDPIPVCVEPIKFSRDGSLLLVHERDQIVHEQLRVCHYISIWDMTCPFEPKFLCDLNERQLRQDIENVERRFHCLWIEIDPARRVVYWGQPGEVEMYSLVGECAYGTLRFDRSFQIDVAAITLAVDGSLYAGCTDGKVRMWPAAWLTKVAAELAVCPGDAPHSLGGTIGVHGELPKDPVVVVDPSHITSLTFTLTLYMDQGPELWEVQSDGCVGGSEIRQLAVNADGAVRVQTATPLDPVRAFGTSWEALNDRDRIHAITRVRCLPHAPCVSPLVSGSDGAIYEHVNENRYTRLLLQTDYGLSRLVGDQLRFGSDWSALCPNLQKGNAYGKTFATALAADASGTAYAAYVQQHAVRWTLSGGRSDFVIVVTSAADFRPERPDHGERTPPCCLTGHTDVITHLVTRPDGRLLSVSTRQVLVW